VPVALVGECSNAVGAAELHEAIKKITATMTRHPYGEHGVVAKA